MMFDFDAAQRIRLKTLVGRQRRGILTPPEENELRALIAYEYPKDAYSFGPENLGLLGLGIMAVWYLFPEDFPEHATAA
jgi:hypothetical protein